MPKGQHNISLDHTARNMMEALSIPEERCEELCGLVEEIHNENPNYNLAQIMEQVSTHCENENELRFMFYVIGTKVGEARGEFVAEMKHQVRSLFQHVTERHRSHNFSYSEN
jgi:hypothetical protein